MKKIFLLPFILTVFLGLTALTACSTPEQRAQKLIRSNLKETLHDWSSYESVQFGPLDSVYTTVWDDDEYTMAKYLYDAFDNLRKESLEKVDDYLTQMDIYGSNKYLKENTKAEMDNLNRLTDSTTLFLRTMHKIQKEFKPSFKGWSMQHTFRAKNGMGAKRLINQQYFFDPEIVEIVKISDIE